MTNRKEAPHTFTHEHHHPSLNRPRTTLYSIVEAAAILGISIRRMRAFCAQGRLGYKIGGRWVIDPEQLSDFQKIPRKPGYPKGVPRVGQRGKINTAAEGSVIDGENVEAGVSGSSDDSSGTAEEVSPLVSNERSDGDLDGTDRGEGGGSS